MTRNIATIILLAFAVRANNGNTQISQDSLAVKQIVRNKWVDSLIDAMVGQDLLATNFHEDLDGTMLGALGHAGMSKGAMPVLSNPVLLQPRSPSIQLRSPDLAPNHVSKLRAYDRKLIRLGAASSEPTTVSEPATTSDEGQVELDEEARIKAVFAENQRTGRDDGRPLYRPESYNEICDDVVASTLDAMRDGIKLMEIEFPPIPGDEASYKDSSDTFINNNIQYAIRIAGTIYKKTGKTAQIVLPDGPEYRRAKSKYTDMMKRTAGGEGLKFNTLDDDTDKALTVKLRKIAFWSKDESTPSFDSDIYFFINLSTNDLPKIEALLSGEAKGATAILFNDELDTLRGDLGLPFFPPKELHYSFLSQFTPVFYMRMRDYSRSIEVAPFIINYSGALFREYPAPWQVMVKEQSLKALACVAERKERYSLLEAKNEMLKSLGLADEEGSTMEFLREGYKKETWWEEDSELEQHKNWRV